MSSTVPEGWSAVSLGDLCTFSGGNAFKDKYQGFRSGQYPFIKVSDMNLEGNERFIIKASNWINEEIRLEAKVKLFPSKSVVFAKVGAALLLNRRRILTRQTAIDNNMMAAIPNSDDDNFLYYVLQDVDLGEIVQGGALPSVNQSQMKDIPALVPPLPEQQKIAAILSSVDDVIEKTRAQIDKLKDLKTGMMQELLTKGIGHTAFKDSPVGRIPEGWDVGAISDFGVEVLDGDRGKQYPKESDFQSWGHCLFLSAKNVTKAGFKFSEMVFISEEKDSALRKGKLQRGDIVITTRGTVGNIAFYTDGVPYKSIRINSGMAIIRNPKNEISPNFLNLLMVSPIVTEQIELLAFGSAQPQLTIGIIKGLLVPKPSLDEQNRISLAISSVDTKQRLASQKLDAMLLLKKALMQDLLTGKIRVNVDNKENAVA